MNQRRFAKIGGKEVLPIRTPLGSSELSAPEGNHHNYEVFHFNFAFIAFHFYSKKLILNADSC